MTSFAEMFFSRKPDPLTEMTLSEEERAFYEQITDDIDKHYFLRDLCDSGFEYACADYEDRIRARESFIAELETWEYRPITLS